MELLGETPVAVDASSRPIKTESKGPEPVRLVEKELPSQILAEALIHLAEPEAVVVMCAPASAIHVLLATAK